MEQIVRIFTMSVVTIFVVRQAIEIGFKYLLFKKKLISMTQEQYNEILKIMDKYNKEIELVVFYELNEIPVLAFFGVDYIELTDKIYESKQQFIERNNYTEIETSPKM